MLPPARVVVMSMLNKDKEYAERITDINQQVQTGDVNFEQARVTIETYKWLASAIKFDEKKCKRRPKR